jgi:hypothetical protein
MAANMNDTHEIKKIEYDKIALLGLFITALLVARLVVVFKSRISLSDPVRLSQTGLSVSMPVGQSWQSDRQWQYQENMFSLSSLFPLGSDRPTIWASCRYLLSAEPATPQMRFEQRASEIDAVVAQTNQTQTDTLTIDWARIDKPELQFNMFFGTARLPDNRQLDIEVNQIAGDGELAERIFKRIVAGLEFEDNQLLKAGAEIVAEIKSRGLAGFLDNRNRQAYFLIKDAKRRTIGFTMDVLVDSGTDGSATGVPGTATGTQPNIRAAGLFYIRGQGTLEQGTSFQCSNSLDEFVYKSETKGRMVSSGTETILDRTGVITVRKFQAKPPGAGPDEKSYRLGPAAIPDVFLDQLLMQMLESGKSQIVIDIIEAGGKIIPTLISAIEVANDMTADEDAAYAFMLELLDGREFSEKMYLNDQKQVYLRLARQDNIYILERVGVESIVREFPEHAEHILGNNQILR